MLRDLKENVAGRTLSIRGQKNVHDKKTYWKRIELSQEVKLQMVKNFRLPIYGKLWKNKCMSTESNFTNQNGVK